METLLVSSSKVVRTTLYKSREFKYRLYVIPFIALYSIWFCMAIFLVVQSLWHELFWAPLVIIFLSQILCILGCHWSVYFNAFVTCEKVSFEAAEFIAIEPKENCGVTELVPIERPVDEPAFFFFQRKKYLYNADRKVFSKLEYPTGESLGQYIKSVGLSDEEVEQGTRYYGENRFEMPVPSFLELFKEHAVAPFFVFQVFCVGLWCLDEFWYYSIFTLVMLVVFESTVVAQRLKNMQEFRAMSLPNVDIKVRREGSWIAIKTEELLPGDLIFLENPFEEDITVPCDLLLISGTCIVNESMISGESTPLLKESILETRQAEEYENNLSLEVDRNHLLYGGTKILQVTSSSPEAKDKYMIPSNFADGCVLFVLKTGFSTMQGKLVRKMMFSSERVTANNKEAFGFILFLLIFALAAAGYVLYYAWDDERRSKFKLLIEGALIITAVVPPELPMELSLAVNNSLMALGKYAIFCMEPFRIPLAGKVDVCCFDKTGTLTGENLVVKGVVLEGNTEKLTTNAKDLPKETALVISTCHSLFLVKEGKVVGDPMEKTAVEFVGSMLISNDLVQKTGEKSSPMRILHRFPFSSALKRMSCIVAHSSNIYVACKGAPEVIEERLVSVPSWYRKAYTHLAHKGGRVLALAYKQLTITAGDKNKHLLRDSAESKLIFAGFLVFHCPLKEDSKEVVKHLKESLHHVVMITGDNALTAIHTACELEMENRPVILLQESSNKDNIKVDYFDWNDPDAPVPSNLSINWLKDVSIERDILRKYGIAMTGDAIELISRVNPRLLSEIILHVAVFARASPSQKELILNNYKSLGYTTLMCGDGTNDVGALKQSHVGVALLDGKPEDLQKIISQMQTVAMRKRQIEMEKQRLAIEKRFGSQSKSNEEAQRTQSAMQKRIEEMTMSMEQEEVPMVRLGDASVAAPFTSKISTINSVCNLIRQGRCTLVTTMQMYKILALNSLISAYGLSVLHLEGIRYGDFQVTVTGMLLAGCFLFLSKAQPIEKLAAKRPQPNIFNWYVLFSVLLQFLLHVGVLYSVVSMATRWSFRIKADENTKFAPGLVNTTVYLISLLMQVSTFVVNYQGRPFRESLMENKSLRNSLAIVGGIAIVAASEMYPEFNEWLQLVPMPPAVRYRLLMAMTIDFGGCLLIDHVCERLFFDSRPRLLQKLNH